VVEAINSNIAHTCALIEGGRVKCWGANSFGELGVGDFMARGDLPEQMGNQLPFVDLGTGQKAAALSVGDSYTCALIEGGRVKCWGSSTFGELGMGDTKDWGGKAGEMGDHLPFVDLGTGQKATALATGDRHTCALLEGGKVKCWGINEQGQLGLGDTKGRGKNKGEMGDHLPFVDLGTGQKATAITAGLYHSCVRLESGQVKCWGLNAHGELGLGDTDNRGDQPGEMGDQLPPLDLGTDLAITSLTAGGSSSCAIFTGGKLKCWGDNLNRQLGNALMPNCGDEPGEMGDNLPFADLGQGSITSVAVNGGSTCAIFAGGALKCWGEVTLGEPETNGWGGDLGDALPFMDLGTGAQVISLPTGGSPSCALIAPGQVKCWGYNESGQLGLGDRNDRGDAPGEMGDNLPFVDLGSL
jgi:alpha-tubulin suppressor-like RCC1 family protein